MMCMYSPPFLTYETAYYTSHFKKQLLDLLIHSTTISSHSFFSTLSLLMSFLYLGFTFSSLFPLIEDNEPK